MFDNRTLIRIAHVHEIPLPPAVNQSLKPSSMVLRASFTNSPDYLQSLDRGLQVLRAFNRERPRCTLSEIAAQIGLSRAVARRSLLTLQHLGYVATQGRQFFLTPRVLELGYSYLSSLDLTELAHEADGKVVAARRRIVLDGSARWQRYRLCRARRGSSPDECRARRRRAIAGIRCFDGAGIVSGQIGRRAHRLVTRKYFSLDYRAHDLQDAGAASRNSEGAPSRLRVRVARAGAGTVFDRGAGSFRNRSSGVRS